MLPTSESKLLVYRQGPFKMVRKPGPIDYKIWHPGKRKKHKFYDINLLKALIAKERLFNEPFSPAPWTWTRSPGSDRKNLQACKDGGNLTTWKKNRSPATSGLFHGVFSSTLLISHHTETVPGHYVRGNPLFLPQKMWDVVHQELQAMLDLGVGEMSWALNWVDDKFLYRFLHSERGYLNLTPIPCWG